MAIRHVLAADPANRALMCAAGVPKVAAAWLAGGDPESLLTAADDACAERVEDRLLDDIGRRADVESFRDFQNPPCRMAAGDSHFIESLKG